MDYKYELVNCSIFGQYTRLKTHRESSNVLEKIGANEPHMVV